MRQEGRESGQPYWKGHRLPEKQPLPGCNPGGATKPRRKDAEGPPWAVTWGQGRRQGRTAGPGSAGHTGGVRPPPRQGRSRGHVGRGGGSADPAEGPRLSRPGPPAHARPYSRLVHQLPHFPHVQHGADSPEIRPAPLPPPPAPGGPARRAPAAAASAEPGTRRRSRK